MTEPKATMDIKFIKIAGQVLTEYKLSEKEKKHFERFISDFCKATEKYFDKNKIKGVIAYKIDYGDKK